MVLIVPGFGETSSRSLGPLQERGRRLKGWELKATPSLSECRTHSSAWPRLILTHTHKNTGHSSATGQRFAAEKVLQARDSLGLIGKVVQLWKFILQEGRMDSLMLGARWKRRTTRPASQSVVTSRCSGEVQGD